MNQMLIQFPFGTKNKPPSADRGVRSMVGGLFDLQNDARYFGSSCVLNTGGFSMV
ncbi:MAG TPA: hypothetical protein PLF42_08215 [Anaerolineales bacterium]|nr:hypothetical protein [Anaerolineales bacterium]